MNDWAALLDRFERALDAHEHMIDGTVAAAPAWPADPEVDGPIPAVLVARARALLDRAHAVEAAMQAKLDSMPIGAPVRRPSWPTAATASTFSTRL
jgi:hypothetical protein